MKYLKENMVTGFQVDGILIQAILQNPTDRDFLLSLESQIITHIFRNQPVAKANQGTLEFPPLNSYHRMLVHRTARYYSLKHWVVGNVEGSVRPRVVLWVEEPTQMPLLKLSDLIEPELLPSPPTQAKTEQKPAAIPAEEPEKPLNNPTSNGTERKLKIMKRPKDLVVTKESEEKVKEPVKTLKEKEVEYEEVRKRLFADVPSDPEEYPEPSVEIRVNDELANGGNSSYFDYQYHVPFYPSYYHDHHQQKQVIQKPATPDFNRISSPISIENQMTQVPRTKYMEDLNKIPLPRHILSIAIGFNVNAQKRLEGLKVGIREDADNLIALFPSSEMAQGALKKGLGNLIVF